ncbi:protein ILITYHIA [Zea mays]|uniref:protein ILITYHIA n=1 Tax=Zea mays TaxID=4577 RepID=UPI0009A9F3D5|nr:protein ILITYHIA [Zea mays]XP_020402809.1 protein ILITYHIA [Zea mays]|eukprot:XP_020402701.1 protein ILITYHIA [Zea mays]
MYNSSSMDSCPVLQHGLLLDRQQPRPHPGISKTTQQLDGIYALFAVLRLAVVDTKADGAILKEELWTLIAQNEPSLISLQLVILLF